MAIAPPPSGDRNRSLHRGIDILRAFRPGADLLGNGELAERTGLSRATVSRLSQTLVDCGMLERDRSARAYRLAPPVLSLAHAMRVGSPVLAAASPLMRREAERHRINVGLAAADGDEMVYLESVRYSRRVSWRNVVAGQRVPMELTSLGRAWLALAPAAVRHVLIQRFKARRRRESGALVADIAAAIEQVHRRGFCAASWQPDVIAIAAPIAVAGQPVYALNMSAGGAGDVARFVDAFGPALLALAARIGAAIARD